MNRTERAIEDAFTGYIQTVQEPGGYSVLIGRPLTKTAQVRMCGNSVCPPLALALVAANYTEAQAPRAAA